MRALIPLGQLTILAGTIATASGPHAGAHAGQLVHRFTFEGAKTLEWVVERHAVIATVYGLAAIGVWFLLRRPGGDRRAVKPLTVVLGLLALQGVVGGLQWALKLPTEIVWVHVAIATGNWLAMLWTVAAAGRLEPRGVAPLRRAASGSSRGGRRQAAYRCSPSPSRSASSASSRRPSWRCARPASTPLLARLRSRWWALVLPLSIAVVIGGIALDSAGAHFLTYLALVAVPPLAALALASIVRGGRPALALLVDSPLRPRLGRQGLADAARPRRWRSPRSPASASAGCSSASSRGAG